LPPSSKRYRTAGQALARRILPPIRPCVGADDAAGRAHHSRAERRHRQVVGPRVRAQHCPMMAVPARHEQRPRAVIAHVAERHGIAVADRVACSWAATLPPRRHAEEWPGLLGVVGAGRSCGRIRAGSTAAGGATLIGGFAPRFRRSTRTPLEERTSLKLAERPRLIETHRYPLPLAAGRAGRLRCSG
jgi:hypothetical protein